MGKQINYWMDCDNFLLVAQMVVDLGCTIVEEDSKLGKVIEGKDIGITTPYGTSDYLGYYLHLPEAGAIGVLTVNSRECLDYGYTVTGNALIEASYSSIVNEPVGVVGPRQKKEIHRTRIYCISGYYDENEKYTQRPDCLTKVYHSLMRYVKKITPYTESTVVLTSVKDESYKGEYEYKHKEYMTKNYLDLINDKGYRLYRGYWLHS